MNGGQIQGRLPTLPGYLADTNQYHTLMRIISRKLLREFWTLHPDAEQPLPTWYEDIRRADWRTPNDLKSKYRNASILLNNRVVFNIKGNTYRLVVAVNYQRGIVYLRFLGTHREYDQIDATTI